MTTSNGNSGTGGSNKVTPFPSTGQQTSSTPRATGSLAPGAKHSITLTADIEQVPTAQTIVGILAENFAMYSLGEVPVLIEHVRSSDKVHARRILPTGGVEFKTQSVDRERIKTVVANQLNVLGPIQKHVEFVALNATLATVPKAPPKWIAGQVLEHAGTRLPKLRAIASHPIIWEGHLLSGAVGYHAPTKLFIHCEDIEPSEFESAAEALEFLKENWLRPFPFDTEQDFHRAVLFALTLLQRKSDAVHQAPMFSAVSSNPNSGKSWLLSMIILAVTGKVPSVSSYAVDTAEFRKSFLSSLLEGGDVVFFDNVLDGLVIRNHALDVYLTTTDETYSDRRLGKNENVKVPALPVICVSGINLGVSASLETRTITIRLKDTGSRDPALSTLQEWTNDNRAAILGALLKISLETWTGEKLPGRLPSFVDVVAGPLAASIGDWRFLDEWDTLEKQGSQSTDGSLVSFMEALLSLQEDDHLGAQWPKTDDGQPWVPTKALIEHIPDALEEVLPLSASIEKAAVVSNALKKRSGAIADGMRLSSRKLKVTGLRGRTLCWSVERISFLSAGVSEAEIPF